MTSAQQLMPPPRRINPYALVGIIFGGVLVLLVIVYWLFTKDTEPVQQIEIAKDVGSNLFVVSSPSDAYVFVDGRQIGSTGSKGLSIKISAGEMHNLKISKPGYEAYESVIWGKKSGIHRTEAVLVQATAIASAATDVEEIDDTAVETFDVPTDDASNSLVTPWPQSTTTPKKKARAPRKKRGKADAKPATSKEPASEEAATKTAEKPVEEKTERKPDPTPETKGPDTSNWYSGDGAWSGPMVAARGCTKCHARGINLMSRTDTQWIDFFRKGQYRRYANLNKYFSKKELGRVMVYIVKKRRQADSK
jgi:hypothetical protein